MSETFRIDVEPIASRRKQWHCVGTVGTRLHAPYFIRSLIGHPNIGIWDHPT